MTLLNDKPIIENKIVLVTDICSSSEIMEDLLRTNQIVIWRNLLIKLKENLLEASTKLYFKLYKFTGDGWIIFFKPDYNGHKILDFMVDLSNSFEKEFNNSVYRHLESPPDISGLTFGMDYGPIVYIKMMESKEYVGRPINVACRLQGIVEQTDILLGYRVMISNQLFHLMEKDIGSFYPELIKRRLKNIIRGGDFQCYRISISEIPFKIIKAIYGTENNSVEVTKELVSQIKGGRIDMIASNDLLGGDPDRHNEKNLSVEYVHNKELRTKNVTEGSRFQLP
jgi:class 3 adenylate cyclase